jgi:hypothetical protein
MCQKTTSRRYYFYFCDGMHTFTGSTGMELVGIAVARAHHQSPRYEGHAPFWPPSRLAVRRAWINVSGLCLGGRLKLIYINDSLGKL